MSELRFGQPVWIQRGGSLPAMTPGCSRRVPGIVTATSGYDVGVKLAADDPLDTTGWSKIGDVGRWSRSCVTPRDPQPGDAMEVITPKIIVEVDTCLGVIKVTRTDSTYHVSVNGVVKHPDCRAEDAIRALGNYLAATHPQG